MDWKEALSAARNNFDEAEDGQQNNSDRNENNVKEELPLQKNAITIVLDKKGRNGKTATIVEGLTIPQHEIEELARNLKQKLGVGGSVRNGEILFQGDQKDKVRKFFIDLKFKVK